MSVNQGGDAHIVDTLPILPAQHHFLICPSPLMVLCDQGRPIRPYLFKGLSNGLRSGVTDQALGSRVQIHNTIL